MESVNVEAVRRLFEVWARGDFRSGLELELFHPDVEFVLDATIAPEPLTVRGVEAMGTAWREVLQAWEGFRTGPIENLVEAGDTVVVFNRIAGRGKLSGVEIDAPRAAIFTFKGRKAARVQLTDRQTGLDVAPTLGET